MIHEVVDAAVRLGWALAAWVAALAFVGTVVLLAGLACGTWAVKAAWRVFGPRARCGHCAGAGASCSPSCDSSVTGTPPEPAGGHTADPDYQEAA